MSLLSCPDSPVRLGARGAPPPPFPSVLRLSVCATSIGMGYKSPLWLSSRPRPLRPKRMPSKHPALAPISPKKGMRNREKGIFSHTEKNRDSCPLHNGRRKRTTRKRIRTTGRPADTPSSDPLQQTLCPIPPFFQISHCARFHCCRCCCCPLESVCLAGFFSLPFSSFLSERRRRRRQGFERDSNK